MFLPELNAMLVCVYNCGGISPARQFQDIGVNMNRSTFFRQSRMPLPALLCALAALAFGAPVNAQPPADSSPGAATEQSATSFSDQKIRAFANAQQRVAEISEKWGARISQMNDPEKAGKARESAHKEMLIAVETTGLSVDEYNEIARASQSDPELQERIKNTQ